MTSLRSPLRTWLHLERLEGREVPAAPTLSAVSMRLLGDYLVITGTVQDESPGQAEVEVSGAESGFATVRSDGSFEFITESNGGMITLRAEDNENLESDPLTQSVAPPPENQAPYITIMSVTYGASKQITVVGQVYDENPSGLTVTLSGTASGTTTADENGQYRVTLTASSLGTLNVQTVDALGLQSNIATWMLTNQRPTISGFSYRSLGNNTYEFTGHVADDWSNAGLTVVFGSDIDVVDGKTAVTDSNGDFSLIVQIPAGEIGDVWVTVNDCWALTSDVVLCYFA